MGLVPFSKRPFSAGGFDGFFSLAKQDAGKFWDCHDITAFSSSIVKVASCFCVCVWGGGGGG